jgi:hypothetical protein
LNSSENSIFRYYIRLIAFALLASTGSIIALFNFMFSVWWYFVFPPILGPFLQCAAVVMEVLGAQMIIQNESNYKRSYTALAAIIGSIAFMIAAKEFKVSLIGTKGYAIVVIPAIVILSVFSVVVSRIPRNFIRVIFGIIIMLFGIFIPAWIAGFFVRDLL